MGLFKSVVIDNWGSYWEILEQDISGDIEIDCAEDKS